MRHPLLSFSLLSWTLGLFAAPLIAAETSPRERLSADLGWRFHLGNEWSTAQNLTKAGSSYGPASSDFSDVSWRRVDLPHDWVVELPFDRAADGSHGFRPVGEDFPQNSVGWYRRSFELPKSDAGRRIWLEFDGVFRDSLVFVNGWLVDHHESGYGGFRCDITDVVNLGGSNLVAVRVDATRAEGWWYEGAGIYRHVWLLKTSPLAIAPDGVFAYSRFKNNLPVGPAELHLQTRLQNAAREVANASVVWTVVAPDGKPVAKAHRAAKLAAGAWLDIEQTARVGAPELWSPETPRLYRLQTEVSSAGKVVDRVETELGIRTVAFDANKGFLLNGKPYIIKGTANHQDHAGVGVALPDGLQDFRIAKLKEMGGNAYRSAHNPPTPELLAACDRLGMLVMDENRLLGSDGQHLGWLEELVRRDRNHPSVVMWSVANEEWAVQGTEGGGQVAAAMQDLIKRLDPTRPVTYAAPVGNEHTGINSVIEVRGWNYHIGADNMDAYHTAHPQQPNVGTEQGSTVSTRGIYGNDPQRGYVSAYDDNAPEWANTAKQWVGFFATRPWLSGGFVWTGFDYRGEPTPYSWPCISSHFGIFDTCGFPKDNFWNYQSWWTDKPVLHLLPHWNWPGKEGKEIDVRALSNCDEVELFLDGKTLGKKAKERFAELSWKVAYRPGMLSAKGYRAGQVVAEAKVETTGGPAAFELSAPRTTINADGQDVAVVSVAVVDDKGRLVPTAGNAVVFKLEGPGRIIGVGNGDPSSHEPEKFLATPAVRTRPLNDWRWNKIADPYAATLPEIEARFDDSGWAKADVRSESGPLGVAQRAVFRGRFDVSAAELAAAGIELWFGKIEGGVMIYVNGRKIGRAGDPHGASIYDVKAALHPGENVVAVSLANWGHTAGINKGVQLRLIDESPAAQWRRSVFSGLAQVIVQSTHDSGTIKLTAESKALRTSTLALSSRTPTTRRPELP
ncbi:MAG TPA: beta-galactosidase GalA [Polyangia bacterium]